MLHPMNWYRVASTLVLGLFLVGIASALFFPSIEIIVATTSLFPVLLVLWVVSLLRGPAAPEREYTSSEWYEHF